MAKKEKTEIVREKSGGGSVMAFSFLLVAVALAAGFLGAEAYHQRAEMRELRAEIEQARSGANELIGAYIDKVRDMQKADIRGQVETFGDGIRADIAKIREESASKEDVAKVSKRVDEVAAAKGADFVLLTAAALLKDKVERGLPFGDELGMVKAAGGFKPVESSVDSLAEIAGNAPGGVMSADELASGFENIADDVAFASSNPSGGVPSALEKLWLKVKGLVKVRKLDETGDGAEAIIARVEKYLAAGDTAAAADEFAKLMETAPAGFEAGRKWHGEAAERNAASRMAAEIYSHAFKQASAGFKAK
jgi:hypothetical protein